MSELRNIFIAEFEPMCPIIDISQLDTFIAKIVENGFDWSVSSCLVLLVFSLAAIWGNYPKDERRVAVSNEARPEYTVAVPEHRLKESLIYIGMAQKRMSSAMLDDSLLGVVCFCFFG
jgi:hypothetical protein